MSWLVDLIRDRKERRLIRAMITLAVEEQRRQRETVLIESTCLGFDCSTCRCDLSDDVH